ncbi:MAG: biopolymer transporter ExbD [Planctomycetota bacterium]
MRTTFQPPQPRPPALAMTPMIDVVFLLLIFFVCTASLQKLERPLPADLVLSGAGDLKAEVEPPPELDEVVVRGARRVAATEWTVNDSPCASMDRVREVLAALASIDPGLPVIVDADGPTPLGEVIAAYDAARSAGFATVRFAASAE